MSEKKINVKETIETLMLEDESMDVDELFKKIDTIKEKTFHKSFNSYDLSIVRIKNHGWTLVCRGIREETEEERAEREAAEKAKEKVIYDAELKEYLRLKRKFGKQKE